MLSFQQCLKTCWFKPGAGWAWKVSTGTVSVGILLLWAQMISLWLHKALGYAWGPQLPLVTCRTTGLYRIHDLPAMWALPSYIWVQARGLFFVLSRTFHLGEEGTWTTVKLIQRQSSSFWPKDSSSDVQNWRASHVTQGFVWIFMLVWINNLLRYL